MWTRAENLDKSFCSIFIQTCVRVGMVTGRRVFITFQCSKPNPYCRKTHVYYLLILSIALVIITVVRWFFFSFFNKLIHLQVHIHPHNTVYIHLYFFTLLGVFLIEFGFGKECIKFLVIPRTDFRYHGAFYNCSGFFFIYKPTLVIILLFPFPQKRQHRTW